MAVYRTLCLAVFVVVLVHQIDATKRGHERSAMRRGGEAHRGPPVRAPTRGGFGSFPRRDGPGGQPRGHAPVFGGRGRGGSSRGWHHGSPPLPHPGGRWPPHSAPKHRNVLVEGACLVENGTDVHRNRSCKDDRKCDVGPIMVPVKDGNHLTVTLCEDIGRVLLHMACTVESKMNPDLNRNLTCGGDDNACDVGPADMSFDLSDEVQAELYFCRFGMPRHIPQWGHHSRNKPHHGSRERGKSGENSEESAGSGDTAVDRPEGGSDDDLTPGVEGEGQGEGGDDSTGQADCPPGNLCDDAETEANGDTSDPDETVGNADPPIVDSIPLSLVDAVGDETNGPEDNIYVPEKTGSQGGPKPLTPLEEDEGDEGDHEEEEDQMPVIPPWGNRQAHLPRGPLQHARGPPQHYVPAPRGSHRQVSPPGGHQWRGAPPSPPRRGRH